MENNNGCSPPTDATGTQSLSPATSGGLIHRGPIPRPRPAPAPRRRPPQDNLDNPLKLFATPTALLEDIDTFASRHGLEKFKTLLGWGARHERDPREAEADPNFPRDELSDSARFIPDQPARFETAIFDYF